MSTLNAMGRRGSWFAKIEGKQIPCVHAHWKTDHNYNDPGYRQTGAKWPDFIGALETLKLAALTSDIRPHGNTFRRTGYIALYKIDNVRIEGENLRFEFIEKIALLRRGH
jgi:hypothetical protein